jgi:hypothetical protein
MGIDAVVTVTLTLLVFNESPIVIEHEPTACDVTASLPSAIAPYVATPEHPETVYVPLNPGSVTIRFCVCPVPLNERLVGAAPMGPGVGVAVGVGVGVGVGETVGVGVGVTVRSKDTSPLPHPASIATATNKNSEK